MATIVFSFCMLESAIAENEEMMVQTAMPYPSFKGNVDELAAKARQFLKEKGYPVPDYMITKFTLGGIKFYSWQIEFHKRGVIEYLVVSGMENAKQPLDLQTHIGQYLPSVSMDVVILKARQVAEKSKYSPENYFISKIEYLENPQYVWRVSFCDNANMKQIFNVCLMDMGGIGKTWIESPNEI